MSGAESANDYSAEEIKHYYSEWWENPGDIRNVVFSSLNEYVRQRMPQSSCGKAMDIGSGHGTIVSYLVEKGYDVTAIEFNEDFAIDLKREFDGIKVVCADVRSINFDQKFDVVTCIELVQNLNRNELVCLLAKLATAAKLLLINISNRTSFHARWVEFRGWKAKFVFNYTPKEFEKILEQAGFHIIHRRGIGLVTPISLFKDFKGKLVPLWFARVINKLDPLFPKICHLYYAEAVSEHFEEGHVDTDSSST